MSVQARQEYAREISARYTLATRRQKSRILDEFTRTYGCNRKYAVGLLRHPPSPRTKPIKRPRATIYDEPVRRALTQLWEISHGLCSKRLVPFLPELMEALERHDELCLAAELKGKLLAISPASADRLLALVRRSHPLRGKCTTKSGTLLKEQIKVRTSFGWDESRPGYFEVDLVAHCAESAAGEFLYTLTFTDIATGWTENDGLPNRGERAVVDAIERIRKRLPFPIRGIDSDNGSEFINHLMKKYCDERSIEFTRSRPYRKNDQCHVEQKNWTVVRQFIGYARYEGQEECRLLQVVHRWLRLYVNFFQPSMKIEHKERSDQDGKTRKRYKDAATPYRRLVAAGVLAKEDLHDLNEMYQGLNPREILDRLNEAIRQLQQAEKVRFSREATNPA